MLSVAMKIVLAFFSINRRMDKISPYTKDHGMPCVPESQNQTDRKKLGRQFVFGLAQFPLDLRHCTSVQFYKSMEHRFIRHDRPVFYAT